MWKCLLLLFVLVAVSHVECRRSRSGRGRGNRAPRRSRAIPASATRVAIWTRELPENVEHQESAYSHDAQVYFQSAPTVRKTKFKPSVTIYDFSAEPPMEIVKVKRKCFLMETPTYQSSGALVSLVTPFNGTRRRGLNTEVERFVTDLSDEQTQQLQSRAALNAALNAACPKPIKALTAQQPPVQGKTKMVQVASLDGILSIKTVKGGRGGRRNRGEGERRSGGERRRGGGGGRRNRGEK